MTNPEQDQTKSNCHCPHCGCRQEQQTMDAVVYVGGISGIDCDVCGNFFTVGETVTVGFGSQGGRTE